MESKWTDRTALLLGGDKMQRLAAAHILVVGVGGVGAYAAEMLCRAGVGEMTIIDADTINVTNINRQLPATHSTIGLSKVEVLANRFRDINPEIRLHSLPIYLEDDEVGNLLGDDDVCQPKYSFIIDAIDTIAPKCALITESIRRGIPIVSSMGAGAKSDITQIRFADIWDRRFRVCGNVEAPQIWFRNENAEWFTPEPTTEDYLKLSNMVSEYVEFYSELNMEQNEGMSGMGM